MAVIIVGKLATLLTSNQRSVPKVLEQATNDIEAILRDGGYYKRRMGNYIKQNKNTKEAIFVVQPANEMKNMVIN